MDKNQREARRHQEDVALNRGLLWVVGAIVLECLLLIVNRYYINFYVSEVDTAILVRSLLVAVRIGGAVLGILALCYGAMQFRKGSKYGLVVVAGLACCALALCSHVVLAFEKPGIQMLFMLVPAWAGLALVYYLYQREFFLAASAVGMAALGLWFVRYGGVGLEVALMLLGIVAVTAVVLWLKKSGGVVRKTDGTELRVLAKDASYALVLASCLVGVVAIIAALALGATVAYYLIFAMVAWLFALLVYYTVKLM